MAISGWGIFLILLVIVALLGYGGYIGYASVTFYHEITC